MTHKAAAVALIVALVAAASPAFADDDAVIPRRMRFAERGQNLVVTTSVTEIFDIANYEALGDGIPSTVVIHMLVYRDSDGAPLAEVILERKIVYDIWDEVYQVQLDGPTGRRRYDVKYRAEALKLVTSLDEVPVARLANVPHETHYRLGVLVQLNPVSPETLAEVRRWLTRGAGGGLDRGGSFFGSFVSVFVNPRIAEADRVIRLRSQPFFRPRS